MPRAGAIRWLPAVALLAVMAGLGMLLTLTSERFGILGAAVLFLLVPALIFVLPSAVTQAIRNLGALLKNLTWWHGLWLLTLLSGFTFRIRDVRDINEEPLDPWALFRIALMGITAFVLVGRLALRKPWVRSLFRGLVGALAFYALACGVSAIWSVYPSWTFYKSLEYLVDVALLAAILVAVRSVESYKTLFNWTSMLCGLLLASVCLGALVQPKEALLQGVGLLGIQLRGVLIPVNPNGVGGLSAFLAIVASGRLLGRLGGGSDRAFYSLLLAVSLATLILSQTRSAITGFLLGLTILLAFSKRSVVVALVILTTCLLSFTSAPQLFWTYFQRGQSPELFQSLSGRVNWWEFAWEKFLQHPWTGLGAYAGARFAVLAKLGETDTSSIHNTYVEVIVGTSIWGLIPLLVAMLGTWWLLLRFLRNSSSRPFERQLTLEALALLASITVQSFFSVEFIWHPSLSFLLVLGYAELLRRRQKWIPTVNTAST